jgi:DNA-directed RNA polymerase subunit RPC12/RpoP
MLPKSMARADYRRCRECGRPATEVGTLSHTRLCPDCSVRLLAENNLSIHFRTGPGYERRQYVIALREFGPRVALALKQAGMLSAAVLDDSTPHP